MTDHQQPELGELTAPASPFVPMCPGDVGTPDSGAVPSKPLRDGWEALASEPVSIRSMPADFAEIDLGDEKAPSADQLVRRARLQRLVLSLVAVLGLLDVVMLWTHYR